MPVTSELYYYNYQSGPLEAPPVVLIHGAGGNHLYWPSEIRRLPGYHVFAIDLPGHGKSGGCGQQSIAAYAEQVHLWLEQVGMHQAVFIGHSMGSAIALTLALQFPEHVLGLGLVGGGPRLHVRPDILSDSSHPTTFHKAIECIAEWSFSPSANPRLVEMASARMLEIRPSVLHGDLLACDRFDLTGSIPFITQPTVVVCGVDDRLTPLRYSQFLAGNIAGAALKVIPAAGHMVMLEQPDEVAAALLEFLTRVPYLPGETHFI